MPRRVGHALAVGSCFGRPLRLAYPSTEPWFRGRCASYSQMLTRFGDAMLAAEPSMLVVIIGALAPPRSLRPLRRRSAGAESIQWRLFVGTQQCCGWRLRAIGQTRRVFPEQSCRRPLVFRRNCRLSRAGDFSGMKLFGDETSFVGSEIYEAQQ